MVIKRELARRGDRMLREVQFVGVSGQVGSLSHEVDGPDKRLLATREEAEAALLAGFIDATAKVLREPRV